VRARGGKDVTKDDMEIVSAVHRALAGKVGHQRYAVWFGRGVRMEPRGKTLRIAAADTRLQFLRRTFHAELSETARGIGLELEFVVDPAVAADIVSCHVTEAAPQHSPHGDSYASSADHRRAVGGLPQSAPHHHDEGQARHHPPRRIFASLGDFLASEPNRVAFSAAQTAAAQPGRYSPLTIVGPPGTGKTHLLEGIWRQIRTTRAMARVVYLSAEQFTNQFLDALRQSGTPGFRHKIRNVETLLIDDVQFFGGKQSTIVELVHTVDALIRGGRQVVFAADRPPAELRALGPEIVARISGGLVCTLEPADCATRLGILRQLAARQGMAAPLDVLEWMASQLSGDARHLAGALNLLRAGSEAHEQPIDLDFAQITLSDLIHASRRPVRLPDIVEAVCDVLCVGPDDLKSSSKTSASALPRMLVMFLARKWTRAALSEISHTLGRKSHSTVVSAQHKITQLLAAGKSMPLGHGQCRIEDAIKRIEAHLRLA
jgi:chromosomal replication initiator protein